VSDLRESRETIVGWLFAAALGDRQTPGVVVIGPENYQKE
jgi:hypothetical protein